MSCFELDDLEGLAAQDVETIQRFLVQFEQKLLTLIRASVEADTEIEQLFAEVFSAIAEAGKAPTSNSVTVIVFSSALAAIEAYQERLSSKPLHERVVRAGSLPSAREERHEWLNVTLKKLPREYRNVFLLRDVLRVSLLETAAIVGVSVDEVRTGLRRARLMLRRALERTRADEDIPSSIFVEKDKQQSDRLPI